MLQLLLLVLTWTARVMRIVTNSNQMTHHCRPSCCRQPPNPGVWQIFCSAETPDSAMSQDPSSPRVTSAYSAVRSPLLTAGPSHRQQAERDIPRPRAKSFKG